MLKLCAYVQIFNDRVNKLNDNGVNTIKILIAYWCHKYPYIHIISRNAQSYRRDFKL